MSEIFLSYISLDEGPISDNPFPPVALFDELK
jgi:hypothetical protein